jgi:glycosyltransferase involved in cell wall biosynthesis
MRQALERQVSEAGLQEKVFLPGAISMPEIVLSKSMLFVLSSRFEGFPMALVEAMCCGLPVLSFDCPTGPNEIVQNGVNGRLVPAGDVQALSNAIRELICDEGQRRMFGSNARSVIERYSLRSVMDKWENTIEHVRTRRCMRTDTNWEPKQR